MAVVLAAWRGIFRENYDALPEAMRMGS